MLSFRMYPRPILHRSPNPPTPTRRDHWLPSAKATTTPLFPDASIDFLSNLCICKSLQTPLPDGSGTTPLLTTTSALLATTPSHTYPVRNPSRIIALQTAQHVTPLQSHPYKLPGWGGVKFFPPCHCANSSRLAALCNQLFS